MLFNPKSLDDAKAIIENTVVNGGSGDTWLNKIGLDGVQEAIDNFNGICSGVDGFFNACNSIFSFINKCFTQEHFFIDQVQTIAPDFVLITLAVLVVLNFIGFKKANKYTVLVLVIAFLISIM